MYFCFVFSTAARLIKLKIRFIQNIFQLNYNQRKLENSLNEFYLIFIWFSDPNLLQKKSVKQKINQRTNGPVNAHLISWPSQAQNIQNLENIW